jgi:3,4-dihydroxy 2-butanone 4-phosphate synthase/GTP cyclohydrolase II
MNFKKIGPTTIPSEITRNTFNSTLYIFDSGNRYYLITGEKISKNPLVRITSRCVQGHIFGSKRCDCRNQFFETLRYALKKNGLMIYCFDQDGRGIGLENQMKAYMLGDDGIDSYDALGKLGFKPDEREYSESAKILKDLGFRKVRLLTNNPDKVKELEKRGIKVKIVNFHPTKITKHNKLEFKARRKLGHAVPQI